VIVGYARVSRDTQDESLQLDALKLAGCEKVFVDRMSGVLVERPQLDAMLNMLRRGDKVVIWKLDRLGRSTKHLIELMERFDGAGIDVQIISGSFPVDTSSPFGKFTFQLFAALAELERGVIIERTMAGLAAARARGRIGGRPRALNDKKVARAIELMENGATLRSAARQLNTHHSTLHRYLHPERYKFPMGKSNRRHAPGCTGCSEGCV
jgi:DNA invertase Pin-like site-specific DNA recombinase